MQPKTYEIGCYLFKTYFFGLGLGFGLGFGIGIPGFIPIMFKFKNYSEILKAFGFSYFNLTSSFVNHLWLFIFIPSFIVISEIFAGNE